MRKNPVADGRLRWKSYRKDDSAHAMTATSPEVSYGYQIAAAAEFVAWPVSAAKIAVRHPPSANTTALVSPDTPAPMIATLFAVKTKNETIAG